jgi:hypothetical protein
MLENAQKKLKRIWEGAPLTEEEIDRIVLEVARSLVSSRAYERAEAAAQERGFLPPVVAERSVQERRAHSDIALRNLFNRMELTEPDSTWLLRYRINELVGEMEDELYGGDDKN